MAEPIAVPDNTPEGIARSNLITTSRAFVRGQGAPDHLYSDDSVIAEYERFKTQMASNWATPFVLALDPVTTSYDTSGPEVSVVKKAEYSTVEDDTVPYYGDKAESDWPTPSDPNLPAAPEEDEEE